MPKFRRSLNDDEGETQIDISPLIDCVFILLIFFIVTTTFIDEKGMQVEKPEAAATATPPEKEPLIFQVGGDGRIRAGGVEVAIGSIQGLVRRALQADPDAAVIVSVAPESRSQLMVRVMDEARAAGATKINVSN